MTMNNEPGNAKLFSKMALVMGRVRTLEKTGYNKFDKYDYVTADAIATQVGSAMADVGLAFFPSIVDVKTEDYATKAGGSNFRTVVHMQMTIACSETGAAWTSDWFGEAIDRSDKSISKAAVSAVKYFLLKTFLLAGGDEEDADAGSPTVDARQTTQSARRATPPQPAIDSITQHRNGTQRAPAPATEGDSNGDVLFDREADRLEKLHRHMHALGHELYGDKWDEVRARNVKRVSEGRTDSSKELLPREVQALIDGMTQLKQQKQAA